MLFARDILQGRLDTVPDPQQDSDEPSRSPGKHRGRKPLPKDLPRKRVVYEAPADELTCPCCNKPRTKIGEEVSEQLEFEPASLYVIEHVRFKYACKHCEANVVTADKPLQPIDKGLPGPGLLAHVITSKYADHLPLYRLERIFRRHGVEIPRSTSCGWMAASAALLKPLYELMKQRLLQSKVIHTDDTPVPVQDRTRNKTRQGRVWVYVGDHNHPYTVFDFTPTRSRDGPVAFLDSFNGYLQADAYSGYDVLYSTGKVTEVACWAHARRKFFDSRETDPARANVVLAMIRLLYDVERDAKDLPANERRRLRQQRSWPRLEQIKSWVDEEQLVALPKSPIGQAIRYCLSNWAALIRYVDDGDLHIDNNPAENALRSVVIGRKNWLFAGSDNGGRTAATLCSFIASCQLHEIDPFAYLRDVLTRISACPINEVDQFMPDNWRTPRAVGTDGEKVRVR